MASRRPLVLLNDNYIGEMPDGDQIPGIDSGTYDPVITPVLNVDSSVTSMCTYNRVLNTVTVSGSIQVSPTAIGRVTLRLSLPEISDFQTNLDVGGAGCAMRTDYVNSAPAYLQANASTDLLVITFIAPSTGLYTVSFSVTYPIINVPLTAPINTVAPAVTGSGSVGGLLTCSTGTWDEFPTSYAYQWQEEDAGWDDLSGEISNTFTPDHVGDFRCVVTATNSEGSASANSNAVTVSSAPATSWFGTQLYNSDALGGGIDRCAVDRFTLTEAGTITKLYLRSGPDSTAGSNLKGLIYADNAGFPGELLAVGSPVAVPAGASWFASVMDNVVLPAGDYWLGAVMDNYQGTIDFAPGTSPNSILWASGVSYTDPPNPMFTDPAPTTTYTVDLSVYAEYIPGVLDAPQFVQKTGANSDGSQFKNATFTNPTVNGNAIVVTVGWSLYDEGDLLTYEIEVTDSYGNIYEKIGTVASTSSSSGSKFATGIFIAKNVVGGAGHQIFVGLDTNMSPGFSAVEISGASTTAPVADFSVLKNTGTSPYEALPVDVDATSFVVAAMTCGGAPSAFSVTGFTTINDYHVAGWWPTGSAYLRAPTGPSLSAEFVIPGSNTPGLVVAVIKP